MNKFLFVGVLASAMLAAAGAKAQGLTLCFASAVSNVALLPQVDFVESAVVINDSSGSAILKADSLYGNNSTVGSYWTSAYPANITLPAGCSTIYLMVKNTPPSTSSQWMCTQAAVANGPTNAAGAAFSIVNGVIGGQSISATVMIPAIPNQAPASVSDCPRGY